MGSVQSAQTSFASGEISPLLYGRIDREIYKNSAQFLRNVYVTPLGGVVRRSGTQYIDNTTTDQKAYFISFQFNTEQTYLISFTPGEFKVYKDGVLQATVGSGPISGLTDQILSEMNWTQSADTLLIVHPDIQPIRITRTSDTAWTAVNLSLSNIPQFDFGSGSESVWSVTRGWPRTITFFQQRLWFGGSRSRPQTVWASKIAGFFDFGQGTAQDDEGIEFTIDDDEVNAIVNIFAGRTLQVFTTGGEFFTPLGTGTTLTPDSVTLEKATRHGSAAVRNISNDGATIFVDSSGRVIREYLFLDVEQSYVTDDISFLSEHLIRAPVATALQRASRWAGEYSYFVNSDGTMAVLNRRRAQSFLAWTLFETDGEYEDVAVVEDDVYVSVKRTIDGSDVRFIEKFDYDYYTDAGTIETSGSATTSWSGLSRLEGEAVYVRSQSGYPLLQNTVASGAITTERSETSVEIGLPWTPKIRPVSPEANTTSRGTLIGKKRRIANVELHLNETNGFTITNGRTEQRINLNTFGDVSFDTAPPKFTGWRKIYMRGYSRDPYYEITQNAPIDFHLLAANVEMTT